MKLLFNLLSPLVILIVLIGLFDLFLLKQIKSQYHSSEQSVNLPQEYLVRVAPTINRVPE